MTRTNRNYMSSLSIVLPRGVARTETNSANEQQYNQETSRAMRHSHSFSVFPRNPNTNGTGVNDAQHNLSYRDNASGIEGLETYMNTYDDKIARNNLTPNINTAYFASDHQITTNPSEHHLYLEQDSVASREFGTQQEFTNLANPIKDYMATSYGDDMYDCFAELNSYSSTPSDGAFFDGSPTMFATHGSSFGSTQDPFCLTQQSHHQCTDSASTAFEHANSVVTADTIKIESNHDSASPMDEDQSPTGNLGTGLTTTETFNQNVQSGPFGYSSGEDSYQTMQALRLTGSMSAPVAQTIGQHKCKLCSATFVRARDINRHIRTVHEQTESYSCEICGVTFTRKDSFVRHFLPNGRNGSVNKGGSCFDRYVDSRKISQETYDFFE